MESSDDDDSSTDSSESDEDDASDGEDEKSNAAEVVLYMHACIPCHKLIRYISCAVMEGRTANRAECGSQSGRYPEDGGSSNCKSCSCRPQSL